MRVTPENSHSQKGVMAVLPHLHPKRSKSYSFFLLCTLDTLWRSTMVEPTTVESTTEGLTLHDDVNFDMDQTQAPFRIIDASSEPVEKSKCD